MLKQRLITAAILLPLVIISIFFLPWKAFQVSSGMIVLLAAWEWASMSGLDTLIKKQMYLLALVILMLVFGLWLQYLSSVVIAILIFSIVVWSMAFLGIIRYSRSDKSILKGVMTRALFGFVVLIAFWLGLLLLRRADNGMVYLLLLMCLVWGADTSAYFAGRYWGKRKLAPEVSPNKTWEGLYGALCITSLIIGVFCFLDKQGIYYNLQLILLAFIAVLFSVLGDLTESLVKRQCGLKDSGNLLPGHGGIFDRIDGLIAATPVFAVGYYLLTVAMS